MVLLNPLETLNRQQKILINLYVALQVQVFFKFQFIFEISKSCINTLFLIVIQFVLLFNKLEFINSKLRVSRKEVVLCMYKSCFDFITQHRFCLT